MRFVRLSLVMTFVLCVLGSSRAQEEEYSKYLFNIGGGISFPQGDLGKFVNDGGNFVVGGGFNFSKHIGVDSEFMWQDLPVNSATLQALSTPGAKPGNTPGHSIPSSTFRLDTRWEAMLSAAVAGITARVKPLRPEWVSSAIPIGPGGTDARLEV